MNRHSARNGKQEESVSSNVIRAVAAYANKKPTGLPALTEVVDPDALDNIFAPRNDGTRRSHGRVVFPYAGFQVTILADGSIDVEPVGTSDE